jgi:hypothetical protein
VPAWIDGEPYVDAAYLCQCPAVELAALGYERVIAIVPDTGPAYRDFFGAETLPANWRGTPIDLLQPEIPLVDVGVDYLDATPAGLTAAYDHGRSQGKAIANHL